MSLLGLRLQKIRYILAHPRIWLSVLRARTAPSVELRGLLTGIVPSTVIDVGANAGQFSLLALSEFGCPTIVAFEPSASSAARFRQAFSGNSRVTLHELAIGRSRRRARLHVSASNDSSSLLPITPKQESMFPGTHEIGTQDVEVVPLSDVMLAEELGPATLVKIDVQGAELQVLEGSRQLLDRCHWVVVEASFEVLYEGQALADDVVRWMFRHGWRMTRVATHQGLPHGVPVQADFLFTRIGSVEPADVPGRSSLSV